jgi:hypothetical protein
MKKMIALALFTGLLAMSGCVFIESSSISDSPRGTAGTVVHVTEQGDLGVLHLVAPADLTSKANTDLLAQCQSGHLSNVQTQLSDRDWFWIVQVYKLRATAVCQ